VKGDRGQEVYRRRGEEGAGSGSLNPFVLPPEEAVYCTFSTPGLA